MAKKNLLPIVFLILVMVAVVAYFVYPGLVKTDANPWSVVPDNTALVLQFDQPGDFIDKLKDENSIWQSALTTGEFTKFDIQLKKLESLFLEEDKYLKLLKNSPLLISFHPDKEKTKLSILFVSQIKTSLSHRELKAYLSKQLGNKFAVAEISERGFGGLKIIDAMNETTIYVSLFDGLMVATPELDLLTSSVETYTGTTQNFSADSDFIKVEKTAGKKVDARIFINYIHFADLLKLYANPQHLDALDWFLHFASWTELDLMLKNSELLMTGFTSFAADSLSFLKEISKQSPQENGIYNLCPFNTNILLRLGFSDFDAHFKGTGNSNSQKISKLLGNEVALGFNSSSISGFKEKAFAIVKFRDGQKAEKLLKTISKQTKGAKTYNYNSHNINQINDKSLLSNLFGKVFSAVSKNYFLFVNDYAIFANSPQVLINLMQMYDTGKTLDLNDNFKKFTDNLSSRENVSLYISPRDLSLLFSEFVNKQTALAFMADKEAINDIQGVSFQFTNEGPLAYTNFYVKMGKTRSEENLSLWKIELDDEIVGKPSLVRNHKTNKYMVVAFDKSSNMYLIDTDGQLLWKKRIDGQPQSDIHQVDYFKNGKIQYLFNTRDFIYLIDRKGNFVKNYPKKLNPASTNGISVFDYNRKKDYRLLLAQANKKVSNYNLNGTKVKGWKEPHTADIVSEPVKRVVANNKDYILITDINNRITIVNRKGKERIRIKGELKKARNSEFYVNRTNSKGIILTTNEKGKLSYIKSNGNLAQTDFGDFSKDHFFLYQDFNDDRSVDFIFVDGRKLRVFDRFKKELFSYNFEHEISIKPMYFSLGHKQSVLGVVSSQEKTIYLFDSKGNTIISRGLVGETPFTVGSLNNNRELNLITASGNVLYNYRLK